MQGHLQGARVRGWTRYLNVSVEKVHYHSRPLTAIPWLALRIVGGRHRAGTHDGASARRAQAQVVRALDIDPVGLPSRATKPITPKPKHQETPHSLGKPKIRIGLLGSESGWQNPKRLAVPSPPAAPSPPGWQAATRASTARPARDNRHPKSTRTRSHFDEPAGGYRDPTRLIYLTRPDHSWPTDEDRYYFLGEYTARQGFAYSPTNDLILNFKKPLDRRGRPAWRYKEQAIRRAATAFRRAFGGEPPPLLFVPMPPSKARADPAPRRPRCADAPARSGRTERPTCATSSFRPRAPTPHTTVLLGPRPSRSRPGTESTTP